MTAALPPIAAATTELAAVDTNVLAPAIDACAGELGGISAYLLNTAQVLDNPSHGANVLAENAARRAASRHVQEVLGRILDLREGLLAGHAAIRAVLDSAPPEAVSVRELVADWLVAAEDLSAGRPLPVELRPGWTVTVNQDYVRDHAAPLRAAWLALLQGWEWARGAWIAHEDGIPLDQARDRARLAHEPSWRAFLDVPDALPLDTSTAPVFVAIGAALDLWELSAPNDPRYPAEDLPFLVPSPGLMTPSAAR